MLVPTVRMSFDVINECLDKDDDQYKSNKAETEDCELRVCGQYRGYFFNFIPIIVHAMSTKILIPILYNINSG